MGNKPRRKPSNGAKLVEKRCKIYSLFRKELKVDEKTAKIYECHIYKMCKDKGLDEYINIAFEKAGELIMAKEDPEKTKMIINDLKEHKVSWESSFFVKLKERYEKALDKSVQRPTAVQGVYKCKNKGCSSDLFYTWTMQTRSGDEGMTHFRECAKCGKRGRC